MLVQPLPKTSYKKARKKREPPLFLLGYCYRCYREYGLKRLHGLERHHIYGGNPDRQHSDDYGLYIDLCHDCHLIVTDEKDSEFIAHLKKEGQRRFEARHTRQEFYDIFKIYYL